MKKKNCNGFGATEPAGKPVNELQSHSRSRVQLSKLSRMSVWFVGSGRVFDAYLVDALQKQYNLEVLDQSSFAKRFLRYILSCRTGPVSLTVVIDIKCMVGIKSLTSVSGSCWSSNHVH
jgi:hypothetical protein